MIANVKKISYDNRGSALIMALVVSAVLMVLSLSLLAVSYSFFLSQKNNTSGINEREMFYSAIEAFEQELMNGKHKVFDGESEILSETISQNMDDQLFGTQIIDSIFEYCNIGVETISADNVSPWGNFNLETYYELDEEGKNSYIDEVSRYFELTSIGAFKFRVQMYWEFANQNIESSETDFDKMDGILLHVIYFLNRSEETLIKNERVYRLKASSGGALIVNTDENNNNDTSGGETNTEPKPYWVKFGAKSNLEKYMVSHEFFPDMKWDDKDRKFPYIEISQSEKDSDTFNVFDKYLYIKDKLNTTWTTLSQNGNIWDGVPKNLFNAPGTSGSGDKRTARTDWGGAVPVRIKFVINGFYVDLNIYDFCYTHYVDNMTGHQKFTKFGLRDSLNDAMLEACGIEIKNSDNHNNIIWLYKYKNDDKNFFDLFENRDPSIDEEPVIDENHFSKVADKNNPIFYAFATFPSYYNDDGTLKSEIKIPKYVENQIISIEDVCNYTKYSFERIIGEQ